MRSVPQHCNLNGLKYKLLNNIIITIIIINLSKFN
ncbi:unnamed protein product [Onchocerca flexuosa]|uniref:Uncharacterized protein n=1 Tax=Onchocerca flexuosa TaxID=387005 RepID=A0A183HTD6_9BILA|nr:unnamed protein product [Onchocerca flexuosa]